MPTAFGKHCHLIVVLLLALFPVDVFSDVTETAFYKTALAAHLQDVGELISIVAELKANGAELPKSVDNSDDQSAALDPFLDWITENCTLILQPEIEVDKRPRHLLSQDK